MEDLTWPDPAPGRPVAGQAPSTVNLTGGKGPSFLAYRQEFTFLLSGPGGVVPKPVPNVELAAAEEGRFVEPSSGWPQARERLIEYGIVVLLAERGSGRRTAALRLLSQEIMDSRNLADLEAVGTQVHVGALPDIGSCGFVLDLSEPMEDVEPKFGTLLSDYAAQGKRAGRFLVVLSTRQAWKGEWTVGTEAFTVELGSPDARRLAENELVLFGGSARRDALDLPELTEIWESRPSARDAQQIARRIAHQPELDIANVVGELTNWSDHIDELMERGSDRVAALEIRAVLWACAFNDGGTCDSIIYMADRLLHEFKVPHTDAEALGGPTATHRVREAGLDASGEFVYLDPRRHGLARALRLRLWGEFGQLREKLRAWVCDSVESLPPDDGARVLLAAIQLAAVTQDGQLLAKVQKLGVSKLREPVVQALGDAALDNVSGPYVRARLYSWLNGSPSQDTIDLVADICGGRFGEQKPAAAIVRLGRAALTSRHGRPALVNAFAALARSHPAEVGKALEAWLSDPRMQRAGQVTLMSLVSTDDGSVLILGAQGERLGDEQVRQTVAECWGAAYNDPESRPAAKEVLAYWAERIRQGTLSEEDVIAVTSASLSGPFRRSGISDLVPEITNVDTESLHWKIATAALRQDAT